MENVTLMQGDCLELMKKIPDGSVDMVLADPPYGTTACKWDTVIDLPLMWEQLKRIVKPNGAIVMTAQPPFDKALGASNISMMKYEWIWRKEAGSGHLNAKRSPMKNHENILVFYGKPPTYNPQMRKGLKPYTVERKALHSDNYGAQTGCTTVSKGERYPLTVLEFGRDHPRIHPTQKPVALMEYLIKTYTNEGETVLDFTMGSGTTGVACVNTGRKFIGIELDPEYFATANWRIQEA